MDKNKKIKTKKAFTLIEVLMTMAIIGILASIILVNLSIGVTGKARDAKRVRALKSIRDSVIIYFTTYGTYPCSGGTTVIDGTSDCLTSALSAAGITSILPAEPSLQSSYPYQYWSTGDRFGLRSTLEVGISNQTHDYPNGTSCDSGTFPTCGWYSSCVYKGYGASCGFTLQYGSDW